MTGRKLLIVGGGFAGMALAIRMREIGWAVDLVEVDPEWRVYGAGISITAPTFRAFQRLGLVEELIAGGFASDQGVRICAPTGQVVAEMPARPIAPGLPTMGGIMRPILQEILSRRTRAAGVNVRLGVTLRSYTEQGEQVRVETSDGMSDDYSLVVAADGAFSKMRSLVFPAAPAPQYTGQYCWRLVASRPPEIEGVYFYVAGTVTAGVMPTSATQMYMFLLQAEPQKVRIDESTQWQHLQQLMAPFSGLLGTLRDGLSANSVIICRPLDAILLPRPWHRGRVLLIGDAVHRFEQRRWERCRLVVENSVRIGRMEQTHADPAALKTLMAESEAALREDI